VGSHKHCNEPLGSIKKCWFVAVQSKFVINWRWYNHHKQQNPLSMPQAC